jgi:glycosyltransferase involved in cell wall biosynthesis
VETASTIIANRNGEQFLRQAIDSALNQTRASEVVVVDDGSVDNSREVIRSYGDRVVPIFTEWAGQASAINAGVSAASGTILFLLDADDWSDADRVSTITPLFEEDRDLLWTRHDLRAVDERNRVVLDKLYSFGPEHDEIIRQILMEGKTSGTTSGLVLRRSYLTGEGRIPIHYTTYPDSYLLIRGALVGHGASVEKTLGAHRWHGGSSTAHDWSQFEHGRFYLSLRKYLAEDASEIARRVQGSTLIADTETWWQLKALADWRKSGLGRNQPWFATFVRFLGALVSSELPRKKRLLLALRGVVLSTLPRSLFVKAWWVTHVGRPGIFRKSDRERLA